MFCGTVGTMVSDYHPKDNPFWIAAEQKIAVSMFVPKPK